jgi:hypothetical protein
MAAGNQATIPIRQNAPPPAEEGLHFWHPNRFGVRRAPPEFRQRLHDLHADLEVTWHPIRERWLLWYRRPRVQHPICPGWLLLCVVETSDGSYVPLDDRVMAVAYEQSGFKWGSGRKYWARVEDEAQRERDREQADREQHLDDAGSDHWDHTKIQVSMRGHSSGSKFVRHHAGD